MWRILGHQHITKLLDACLCRGVLAHAYLIVGPPHTGKLTLALDIACAVNCLAESERPCGQCSQCRRILAGQHADVLVIAVPRGTSRKEIAIATVRDIEHQASLMPFEGRCRVFIVEEADRMSEEAANALLKTLEEPPEHVLFVLTASREGALLPTVRSRCQRLELRCLPYEALAEALVASHGVSPEDARRLARLARGCSGVALQYAAQPGLLEEHRKALERVARVGRSGMAERLSYADDIASAFFRDREEAREMLDVWLRWWRDIMLVREGVSDFVQNAEALEMLWAEAGRFSSSQVMGAIRGIRDTLDALEQNASPRLALEALMVSLPLERK